MCKAGPGGSVFFYALFTDFDWFRLFLGQILALFAIVDIETTGSKFPGNRIIDLAIIRHNGKKVVSEWQSLFKPDVLIPPFVAELTGISEEMVAEAPLFGSKAQEIFDELAGCTFVAHDVNFDYSFVRHELAEAGFTLELDKFCTLKHSRKWIPEQPSYSLGKLCESLEIPVDQRHRAMGDARATALLFERLYPFLLEQQQAQSEAASAISLAEVARKVKLK